MMNKTFADVVKGVVVSPRAARDDSDDSFFWNGVLVERPIATSEKDQEVVAFKTQKKKHRY